MKGRDFIKTSLAATALAGVTATAAQPQGPQEYYQLRVYRLGPSGAHELLDSYAEMAAIPALNRLGIKPIGAFTEIEGKGDPALYVLIPYASLESFASVSAALRADSEYHRAGAEYLQTPKDKPAFARIDSWLLR